MMERQKWLWKITGFQARARGCLVRKAMRCVRAEFEDVVSEIDGGVSHLEWKGSLIPKPYFLDSRNPLQEYGRSAKLSLEAQPECQVNLKGQSRASGTSQPLAEVLVPERDQVLRAREPSSPPVGDGEVEQAGQGDGGARESLTETTTAWSSMALDASYNGLLQKGPQTRSLARDVPQTPEALRLHRNTLAMELLWIQQAIASRKKYLTLKQRLAAS